MLDVSIFVAFFAGIVSFLAPCVLPIVPGFLAYLGGSGPDGQPLSRRSVFINAVWFVLGFSVVFALLGVLLNTLLEDIAYDVQIWLARIGGIIIIFFGLYLIGVFKLNFLSREHKLFQARTFKSRGLTSFVFGLAFAAGWTPCVGAVLGSILGLAASQPGIAFWLLFAYALGLGLPFLIVGLFAAQATALIARYGAAAKYINIVFGILLLIIGYLVFTMQLARFTNLEMIGSVLSTR